MEERKEINKKSLTKKIFITFAGLIIGGISWFLAKFLILTLGTIFLNVLQVYGDRAGANLSAIAGIVGFVTSVIVFRKIYKEEITGEGLIKKLSEKQKLFWNIVLKSLLVMTFLWLIGMLNFMAYAEYFLKDARPISDISFLLIFINIPFLIGFIVLYKFINQVFKNK